MREDRYGSPWLTPREAAVYSRCSEERISVRRDRRASATWVDARDARLGAGPRQAHRERSAQDADRRRAHAEGGMMPPLPLLLIAIVVTIMLALICFIDFMD